MNFFFHTFHHCWYFCNMPLALEFFFFFFALCNSCPWHHPLLRKLHQLPREVNVNLSLSSDGNSIGVNNLIPGTLLVTQLIKQENHSQLLNPFYFNKSWIWQMMFICLLKCSKRHFEFAEVISRAFDGHPNLYFGTVYICIS